MQRASFTHPIAPMFVMGFAMGTNGARASLRSRRRGFTLAELAIVVLIVGIITAAAVPEFGDSLQYHRVDSAARRIAFDLNLARNRARMTSADQAVDFDAANGTYTMPGMPDLGHADKDYSVDLSASPYSVLLTYVDFGGSDTVTFNGFGVPDSDGEIDVQAGGSIRTVVLEASGKVSIQ